MERGLIIWEPGEPQRVLGESLFMGFPFMGPPGGSVAAPLAKQPEGTSCLPVCLAYDPPVTFSASTHTHTHVCISSGMYMHLHLHLHQCAFTNVRIDTSLFFGKHTGAQSHNWSLAQDQLRHPHPLAGACRVRHILHTEVHLGRTYRGLVGVAVVHVYIQRDWGLF